MADFRTQRFDCQEHFTLLYPLKFVLAGTIGGSYPTVKRENYLRWRGPFFLNLDYSIKRELRIDSV